MRQEYRLATRLGYMHDFCEGVRAALIDKDKDPKWSPDCFAGVDAALIQSLFSPLEDELDISCNL